MSKVLENVISVEWWFTVVVVGLAINVLSAYAKPITDRLLSAMSSRLRDRINAANARRTEMVERVRDDTLAEVLLVVGQIERFLNGAGFVGLGLGLLWLSRWVVYEFIRSPERMKPWAIPIASVLVTLLAVAGPLIALGGLVSLFAYLRQGRLLSEARSARRLSRSDSS
jgi:hypothetical protein